MKTFAKRFLRENKAVTAIEYGLIAGVIAIAVGTSVSGISTQLSAVFSAITTQLQDAAKG